MDIIARDVPIAAAAYSQLAGTLAGFVFAVLTLLLTNPPKGRQAREISIPLYALLVAALSMIMTSFLFGTLSGEISSPAAQLRIAIVKTLVSILFALAVLQMMASMIWLFRDYGIAPFILVYARRLFLGIVALSALILLTSFGSIMVAEGALPWGANLAFGLYGGLVMFILPALGAWWARRRRQPPPVAPECAGRRLWLRTINASGLFTIAVAIASSFVVNTGVTALRAHYPLAAGTPVDAVLMAVVGAFFLCFTLSLPSDDPATEAASAMAAVPHAVTHTAERGD